MCLPRKFSRQLYTYCSFHIVFQPTPPFIDCNNDNCRKSIAAQIARVNARRTSTTQPPAPGSSFAPTVPGQTTTTATTTTTTTTTLAPIDPEELVKDLKKFCRFRRDGEHALPANCDVFIYCSNGIGSFAFCPNGTKFNPSFLTCDFPVNFECRFDTRKLFFSKLQNLY